MRWECLPSLWCCERLGRRLCWAVSLDGWNDADVLQQHSREMNANLQFYDGMTTEEIQEILIRSANDLISLDVPNYQTAAARLLSYTVNKQVFGGFKAMPLKEMIDLNIERGVYDPEFLNYYTEEEIANIVNAWTRNPDNKLTRSETEKKMNMEAK